MGHRPWTQAPRTLNPKFFPSAPYRTDSRQDPDARSHILRAPLLRFPQIQGAIYPAQVLIGAATVFCPPEPLGP